MYRAGFATSQSAYETAFQELFESLDWLEDRLRRHRYLLGELVTEADWRLFPTLIRFDAVYYGHFKCNLRHVYEYPALWGYHARALPDARNRGDGLAGRVQNSLLRQPPESQPDRSHPFRTQAAFR